MKIKLNIIKRLGILLMVVAALNVNGQQDPMYTQYLFNTQTINPAYAGTWESLSFMVLTRNQWTGLTGAPETYTFSMQAPMKNERVALGLNLINDKSGFEKRFYVSGDYSYLVQLNESVSLRLGLKGGFTSYSNVLSDYSTNPVGSGVVDPAFQGEIDRKFMPNFGIGAFAYSDNFYVGFSVPKILNNEFDDNINNLSVGSEFRHYYLLGGMVFDLNKDLKFKPTILTKASFTSETGGPIQFDLTANFLIKEKFWLGATYRPGEAFGFVAQFIIDSKLRVGYAFDYTTSDINKFENGTHEIMISYEMKFMNKRFISPRYF